jgi:hypothetical protein
MEFSRPVALDRLAGEPVHDIVARAAERAALARRFGLLALDRLAARVTLLRLPGGLLRLTGELVAEVTQECVATLEPVASRVADRFALLFSEGPDAEREVMLSGEAEPVEPIAGDALDIGEAVAQQLSLVLDPYPRAPGAAAAVTKSTAITAAPLAALAKWKEKG